MGSASPDPIATDILIIGAGLAGINCAYRLQTQAPHARIAVLEARADIGGTWNIFQYPGIRSDSDLHTYGFAWEPWPYTSPIAEGPLILSYLHSCVAKYNLDRHIHLQHRVERCDWSSEAKTWTVRVNDHSEADGAGAARTKVYEAAFVVLATGYYDYDEPLPTTIPGLHERFQGKVVHPQFWPTDYDFADKEVVVIGSGATAITLIPNLAPTAKHVTMLQRSPTYIHAITNRSPADTWTLSFLIPKRVKQWLNWLYFAIIPFYQVTLSLRYPEVAKKTILKHMADQLPADISTDPHFTPRYNPWQQRLCLTPEGDFFKCLHSQGGKPAKAGVVTAKIETAIEDGILCEDGQKLKADVIVTATGLKMLFGGGIPIRVDGELIDPAKHVMWEGCMLNDVPNLMHMLGYAWASWTVGVDDTAILLCRLWNDMQKRRQRMAVPTYAGNLEEQEKGSWIALNSTYVKKSSFPTTLTHAAGPWKARGNVWLDWIHARFGSVRRSLVVS
ncbi:putative flavin-binding monooxygenase [Coniella lustricola]|uniref:Putative flavin-binding monooxygenase n=1 Tax=Coniella lustricola TaxID=2025994 RepID=A0A2T3A583_9PEZI|nr:putative flavin-binding monooxygenase [Coniella lustricola]